LTAQDEALARRIYAYFTYRLRQPDEAERLTRLAFQRLWEEANLSRRAEGDPDLTAFAAARAVIADNPRRRGASRVGGTRTTGEKGEATGLSNELAMAIGRLNGRERDALALRFGGELSVGEIAELLDRTPAEVKQRLARGARALLELGVLPKESGGSTAQRPRARGPKQSKAQQQKSDG
jgi:RNA polymerase sigma factor (sigma-70 family)